MSINYESEIRDFVLSFINQEHFKNNLSKSNEILTKISESISETNKQKEDIFVTYEDIKSNSKTRHLNCSNCGNSGHKRSKCKKPIMSFGIILIKLNRDGVYEHLIVQRRNSIGFVEFLKNKKTHNIDYEYIKKLFSDMTYTEQKKLLIYDYKTLRNNTILNYKCKNHNSYESKEINKAQAAFNLFKKGFTFDNKTVSLQSLIREASSEYAFLDWSWPKGHRKNHRESDLDAAIREFAEETGYNYDDLQAIPEDMLPSNIPFDYITCGFESKEIFPYFVEEFTGLNGKIYKYTYFMAMLNGDVKPMLDPGNLSQMEEIGDIQWVSYEDCLDNFAKYPRRLKILHKVNELLENM